MVDGISGVRLESARLLQLRNSLRLLPQALEAEAENYLLAEVLNRRNTDPGSPEFAEAVAARAVRAKPGFVLARGVLSGLYLRSGSLEKSITESRIALKQDPNDRTTVYHLIEALRKSGKTSELPALVASMHKIVEAEAKNQAEVAGFALSRRVTTTPIPEVDRMLLETWRQ